MFEFTDKISLVFPYKVFDSDCTTSTQIY